MVVAFIFIPLPRSSSPSWTTTLLPTIECIPVRVIRLSTKWIVQGTLLLAVIFPRSPRWRMASSLPPWVCFRGLKWPPAEIQPFVLSPNSWIWNPWLPESETMHKIKKRQLKCIRPSYQGRSHQLQHATYEPSARPEITPETCTPEATVANEIVPLTPLSPVRTQTAVVMIKAFFYWEESVWEKGASLWEARKSSNLQTNSEKKMKKWKKSKHERREISGKLKGKSKIHLYFANPPRPQRKQVDGWCKGVLVTCFRQSWRLYGLKVR